MKANAFLTRDDGAVSVDGVNFTAMNPSREGAVYDGSDPFFYDVDVCGNCNERNPPDGLLLCTRCRLIHYCSSECQKKHFRTHKGICKMVHKAAQEIAQAKEAISTAEGDEAATDEATMKHVCAVSDYSDVLKLLSLQHNNKLVLEKTLHVHLDVMCMLAFKNGRPLDALLPFWFLFLNRDDDAYQYCKYSIIAYDALSKQESDGQASDQSPGGASRKEIGTLLKENKKIYPQEEKSRYRDIFQDRPMENDTPLYYVLALFLIKLRLVGKYQAKKANKIPVDDEVLNEQVEQLCKLRDEVNSHDTRILPSLTSPGGTSFLEDMGGLGKPGSLSTYHVLAGICAVRVPGAATFLEGKRANRLWAA